MFTAFGRLQHAAAVKEITTMYVSLACDTYTAARLYAYSLHCRCVL